MQGSDFRPLAWKDGYLPIEDYGLIGDGETAALIGRDGTVGWLCAPQFDSPPLFCSILDARPEKGGCFRLAPEEMRESRQFYFEDSGVLVTEMDAPGGRVAVTDALALRAGADLSEDASAARGELVRMVRVLAGTVRLRVEIALQGGAEPASASGGLALRCAARPDLELHLTDSFGFEAASGVLTLAQGEEGFFLLRWGGGNPRVHAAAARDLVEQTLSAWRRWIGRFHYEGPRAASVRRSALTLKLLDHFENGAIVAAPTSSLPERIGGVRNWDYRYAWIRDAAFSVYALRRIGFAEEALGFLAWALQATEREKWPHVLYDLQGKLPAAEREDPDLEGYRRSRPVRWGNAAADQRQHDVFGEILDCAWQWVAGGQPLDPPLLQRLEAVVEAAAREWGKPDHGIWEVRASRRPFTYSAALCQVALDRGARLWERLGIAGKQEKWRRQAENIRRTILARAWSDELNAITAHLDGGHLDASVLALPMRRVLPFRHPRMVATTDAIAKHLRAGNGLLYRYLPEKSPDGVSGGEGAFLLCSFWLVDNLAGQGRLDEAQELFESLCARTSPLGLLPEQIDPVSGAFRGNYPQALSHVGLISSAYNLARRLRAARAPA